MKRLSPRSAFTLVEMLTVMAVIAILASLILSVNGYVQRKAATSRAEGEIAAMSAACENYRADNGSYPRTQETDDLDSKKIGDPGKYKKANLDLYKALSGDALENPPNGVPESTPYFPFKREQLSVKQKDGKIAEVYFIMDPFGNPYGYSTAGLAAEELYQEQVRTRPNSARPDTSKGHNTTIDLWSTGGSTDSAKKQGSDELKDAVKWVKNW